jgi:hypothetical protein
VKSCSLVLERFELPDGRIVRLDVDYDAGDPGSYWNPPEPSELTVSGGCEMLSPVDEGRELTAAEVGALNEDVTIYERLCDAAAESYSGTEP